MLLSLKRSSLMGIAIMLVAAASLLASCAAPNDLSAIQKYASVTAQSASSFAAIARRLCSLLRAIQNPGSRHRGD